MFRFLFSIFWLTSAMTFAQNVTSKDSSEFNQFIQTFDNDWNMQNPQRLVNLWIQDGDLMTGWGRWIRGQNQLEKYFLQEKDSPFSRSKLQQSIDAVRFLSPQLAYVDATMKFSGIEDPSSHLPSNFVQHAVYVLTKMDNVWKIVALRIYQFQPQHVD